MCVAPLTMFKFVFASRFCSVFHFARVYSFENVLAFAFRFGYGSFCVLCDRRRLVHACCMFCPREAPKHLGLRVLRARGYRGEKQQEVGWLKTVFWPSSAPSQMWMGRDARSQRTCVCYEYARNAGVRPPNDSESRVARSESRVNVLCYAGRKNRLVSGPRVRRAGSGRVGALGLSHYCFLWEEMS